MMVLQGGSDTTDHFLGKGNYYMVVIFVLVCSRRCETDGHRLPWAPGLGAKVGGCEGPFAEEQALCFRPKFKPRDAICSRGMERT